MAENAMNDDLRELQGLLVKQSNALIDRLPDATTTDEVRKIQDEITELNHRVTIVGNLLFTQQTAKIASAMGKVRKAKSDVDQATAKIGDLVKFLKTMTSFLVLVDKVIDTAKLIIPIATI
jgi:hypothetical protein